MKTDVKNCKFELKAAKDYVSFYPTMSMKKAIEMTSSKWHELKYL